MAYIPSENPYEYLKLDEICGCGQVPTQFILTVGNTEHETIRIHTSQLPNGRWCYGYSVYWKNGRQSILEPDPSLGLFFTRREAHLYALGFMSLYADFFTEDSNHAIRSAITIESQGTLF